MTINMSQFETEVTEVSQEQLDIIAAAVNSVDPQVINSLAQARLALASAQARAVCTEDQQHFTKQIETLSLRRFVRSFADNKFPTSLVVDVIKALDSADETFELVDLRHGDAK